jgi:hypothetical protein
MKTKKRHVIVALGSLLVAAVLSGVAAAGNPHGTPPGQAKRQSTTAGASASVRVKGSAKVHAKGSASVHAKAGVHARGSASLHARGGNHQSSTVVVATSAAGNGTGVKAGSTTGFNMRAAAGSSATKLYGNGQTAGRIAEQHGAGASAMLFGPGNSQPHKVALCLTIGKFHLVDVHALKAHAAASCLAVAVSVSGSTTTSTSGSVSVGGSVHGKGVGVGAKAHAHAGVRSKTHRSSRSSGVLGASHSSAGSVNAQAKPATAVVGTANFTG